VLERRLALQANLQPLAASLALRLREISELQSKRAESDRQQRIAAGRARAELDEREHGEWRRLALRHARRLRAADPDLSQAALADLLIAALPNRLPKRDAVIRWIRRWETAGDLRLSTARSLRARHPERN
jgi:hypothetical protein